MLRAARINLKRPPRIATETAITQYEGVAAPVPAGAAGARVALSRARRAGGARGSRHRSRCARSESFLVFLREDLLPRSDAGYALGPEIYARKLAADEMERTPVDSLLVRARGGARRERGAHATVAERVAPGGGVAAALAAIEQDRPTADSLVPYVAARLDRIRGFLRDALDPDAARGRQPARCERRPEFRRSLSFASMESPGVWEKRASEAYYNVTPVEPDWTDAQKRDHLAFFNRHAADVISIHEALPGHYYQFLALRKTPSRLRQVFTSGSYTEGWAHYCEQMMLEQGFGAGDAGYELAQLVLANRRIGRFIVGISMHTRGMTYEEGVRLFEERCYMAPITAAREARRGTMDPTYLVYTLGKWRILELRDEVQRGLGSAFDLKKFHDALLRQGASPLPVVRAGVLHELGLDRAAR